jgi:uncharacterized membrane protein YfcA
METMVFSGFVFFFSGFIQGLTGFGSALVAIPLLSLFIDIKMAIPLCILNSLIINGYLSRKLYPNMDRKKLSPLCISTLPGILVGTHLLQQGESNILGLVFGILLIVYGFYNLFSKPRRKNLKAFWSYIAGFTSGVIGASLSTGGPPVIIYTTQSGWGKNEIKATLIGFFLFTSILTSLSHLLSGVLSIAILTYFLATAPFVLLGTVVGERFFELFTKYPSIVIL